jgi:hypothetical protein
MWTLNPTENYRQDKDRKRSAVEYLGFFLVKAEGFEPSTYGLKVRCSTS